ncbi:LOW QUALITY PROTEIN: uncharacterized protein LOC124268011 [Haliotis rubra]|uniref:LOW QUALITY PROTEIN: uncharacterized protein LOC124268011 n=1 Tax=Haliotis rubra TaxID=36100 RepID=UPI001EE582E6|nr:LOW QUALITY PROTEIN: uncharacterized protein LOC124268011 [Haliotis rubra]
MGVAPSSLQSLLACQKSNEKCYPCVPFRPCPPGVHAQTKQGLVASFKALPPVLARGTVTADTIWWTSAQFLPYNDRHLAVTTTPYTFRVNRPWLVASKMPAGKIFLYDIGRKPIGCVHFKGISSSTHPTIQPHPIGEYIAYIPSSAGVKVIGLNNEHVYEQPASFVGGSCKYFAIAPNGINLATIFRGQNFYFIRMNNFNNFGIMQGEDLKCHLLCPGFVGDRFFSDKVECRWSPDSHFLAVGLYCAGSGKLFVLDKNSQKNICTVCPDLLEDPISSACSFDFDPRPDRCKLAVASTDDCIYIIDVKVVKFYKQLMRGMLECQNCIQYNNQGTMLAVGYETLDIRIFDPDTEELLHVIDVKDGDEKLQTNVPCHTSLAIMRLSFNWSGTLLASSVCDGLVRVWTVPGMFSLQRFCKLQILSLVPVRKVKTLNLPEKIKHFLLSP